MMTIRAALVQFTKGLRHLHFLLLEDKTLKLKAGAITHPMIFQTFATKYLIEKVNQIYYFYNLLIQKSCNFKVVSYNSIKVSFIETCRFFNC